MKRFGRQSGFVAVVGMAVLVSMFTPVPVLAQSKPQKTERPAGEGKKNTRPVPLSPEEQKKAEEERKAAEEEKNAIVDTAVEKLDTRIVNVDAVVINKKTGAVVQGLKKENFAIFENGVKQEISNFSTPDAPITVTLVVEFSKWSEIFGRAAGGGFEPGTYEVLRPVSEFLTRFIHPPNDYASVIAFDLRPTTITDFTNDPKRINDTISLLLHNYPAFTDSALYDALKFSLVGGKGDTVVLEDSKAKSAEFGGMVDVKAKRKAIILVASGINTFSHSNYDEVRRLIQESGVPIYVISTANLFCKRYCDYLDPSRVMPGTPDRLTFEMARVQMDTFAKESGGAHYPMTFASEAPAYLNSINAMLRSQYSLAYDLAEDHLPGKKYKIDVKVDVDGDGVYDDKAFIVQHRPFYTVPRPALQKPVQQKAAK
jgi:Ca-activated chloride channel family protein